jgi:hypothetical protein
MSFLAALGSIIDGVSKIRDADIAKKGAELSAAQKELGARAEIDAAAQDEAAHRIETQKFMGRMRAAQAQSGLVGVSSDSVERQSAIDAELDALNIRYQGQLRGWALRENLQSELQAGRSARTAGTLSGAGSILRGVADYRRGS